MFKNPVQDHPAFQWLIAIIMAAVIIAAASCINMDARTGCTDVRVTYSQSDCHGSSMSPALDYHREGVGQTASNAARQDGKLPVTPLALGDRALDTIEDIATSGATKAGRELGKLVTPDAKPLSPTP